MNEFALKIKVSTYKYTLKAFKVYPFRYAKYIRFKWLNVLCCFKACKDSQTDPDFVVIARVEALIAGWGLDEALRRAEAYRKAGADAILMHSKKSDPSDIEAFMKVWKNQVMTMKNCEYIRLWI